ncbi:MAG: NUDIX hydrolase [Oscillospiraceae bacterium]
MKFQPLCRQEEVDREVMLTCLERMPDVLRRENLLCHFTASAWIVNPGRDKVLFAHHNIYNSWTWIGGHADGESDMLAVALRETAEETGIDDAVPVSRDIFSIETIHVDPHIKRGSYVPDHEHFNVTYLLEAQESEAIRPKLDENSGVRWFSFEDAINRNPEPCMVTVFKKIVERLGNGYPSSGS